MKKELVQIKLHGHLGKSVKKSNWSLAVKSVSDKKKKTSKDERKKGLGIFSVVQKSTKLFYILNVVCRWFQFLTLLTRKMKDEGK